VFYLCTFSAFKVYIFIGGPWSNPSNFAYCCTSWDTGTHLKSGGKTEVSMYVWGFPTLYTSVHFALGDAFEETRLHTVCCQCGVIDKGSLSFFKNVLTLAA